jgi:hypothetical protein
VGNVERGDHLGHRVHRDFPGCYRVALGILDASTRINHKAGKSINDKGH